MTASICLRVLRNHISISGFDVNGVEIVVSDVSASNGIVHIIGSVLKVETEGSMRIN